MKVLMITQDYPPHVLGGIGRHAKDLTQALTQEGLLVTVLTLKKSLDEQDEANVIRAPYSTLIVPSVENSQGWSPLKILQENVQLAAMMYQLECYDVIHCQDLFAAPAAYIIAQLKNIPLVFTKHFITPLDSNFSKPNLPQSASIIESYFHQYGIALQKWCFFDPTRIIAISKDVKDSIIKILPTAEKKCVVIPNGTNILQYADKMLPAIKKDYCKDDELLIVVVGRLVWKKGGDVAIKAVKALKEAKVKLVFAGLGEYQEELKQLAIHLGIQKQVAFLGFVEGDVLYQLYAAADIVLLPSRTEGFSISIVEALTLKKMVVASDIAAIKDIQIKDHYNGLLFAMGDEKDLADKIQWVIQNPHQVKIIQKQAGVFAKKEYSWTGIAKKTIQEYTCAIENHHSK